MKVILIESTNNVGMVGDIVNVKAGFARNYLLPQNKAVVADEQNIKKFAHQQRMLEKKIVKAKEAAKSVKDKLDGQEVTLIRKTAKANKLFGSVTTLDIQRAIQEQLEVDVNRKGILLGEPIKQTGTFPVVIKLDGGVQAALSVVVEKDITDLPPEVELPAQPAEPAKTDVQVQGAEAQADATATDNSSPDA